MKSYSVVLALFGLANAATPGPLPSSTTFPKYATTHAITDKDGDFVKINFS